MKSLAKDTHEQSDGERFSPAGTEAVVREGQRRVAKLTQHARRRRDAHQSAAPDVDALGRVGQLERLLFYCGQTKNGNVSQTLRKIERNKQTKEERKEETNRQTKEKKRKEKKK